MEWKRFMTLSFQRLVENFLSVKVWLFLIPFVLSSLFLFWFARTSIDNTALILTKQGTDPKVVSDIVTIMNQPYDAFKNWLTFLVSLAGTIIVAREIFKVKKITAISNGGDKEELEKIKT